MNATELTAFKSLLQALIQWDATSHALPVLTQLDMAHLELNAEAFLQHQAEGAFVRPYIVGIAGGSASGKTRLTDYWQTLFDDKHELSSGTPMISAWGLDNYYYDLSQWRASLGHDAFFERFNHDVPDAFELSLLRHHLETVKKGQCVRIPQYNHVDCSRQDEASLQIPTPFIVVEGIFALSDPSIRELMDLTIYVETDEETRKARWLERAVNRGKPEESARACLTHVFAMHDQYVEPTKQYAQLVVNGAASVQSIDAVLARLTQLWVQTFYRTSAVREREAALV